MPGRCAVSYCYDSEKRNKKSSKFKIKRNKFPLIICTYIPSYFLSKIKKILKKILLNHL